MKIWMCRGQITLSKIDENCPLAIPNQISTISMHIPILVKIYWYLLKLTSGNENTDVLQADHSVTNRRNLLINNPKTDQHNTKAHTEFWWNPLTFTQVVVRKRKYRRTDVRQTDGWTYGRWAHGHRRETIITRRYRVARCKKEYLKYCSLILQNVWRKVTYVTKQNNWLLYLGFCRINLRQFCKSMSF